RRGDEYAIRHKDLIRLADLYGLEVVVGQPIPASPASQAQELSEPAPVQAVAVPLWGLKSQDEMKRRDYLRDALYEFLSRADKTQPLPTPGQVLEAWRVNKPIGVARVNSASVDYETTTADGEKPCDLAALKERIKNMTTAPGLAQDKPN
ncbi:MAG TPA: hypothetical protein VMR43_03355, partial [Variovorax sp.]|nr:hypothetical protein [Variovorax sp.]